MRPVLAIALWLGLAVAVAGPALAAIPEGAGVVNPIPEAPAAPSSLNAVIELLKRGDNAGALKGSREFVKSQPGSAAGHEVHGVAAQVNRLSREAEAAYSESLRLEPGRVPVMLRLGQLALEAREAKKAEGWFRKALAANPDLGAARRGLALSLLAQRQLRPALAEIEEALKRSDGRDVDAKYLLAQIMNDAGRPSAAEPVLDGVLAAPPDHLPALLLQGLVKLELRKTDEAEALFARVVQRDPKSTQARLGLALVERAPPRTSRRRERSTAPSPRPRPPSGPSTRPRSPARCSSGSTSRRASPPSPSASCRPRSAPHRRKPRRSSISGASTWLSGARPTRSRRWSARPR